MRTGSAPSNSSRNAASSYYGKPVIKAPVWKHEIGWYFFAGGLAGASSLLAVFGRLQRNDALAGRALFAASAGAAASPILLIADLGRPERFLNMLRVLKPTSPMNVGAWILTAYGPCAMLAALAEILGVRWPAARAAEVGAALLGSGLATYTGVLLADTSVPVWQAAKFDLPSLFAAGAAASAGAWATATLPNAHARSARRLTLWATAAELVLFERMRRRLGRLIGEPYERDAAGLFARASVTLSVAGLALLALAGRRKRAAAAVGGACVLAGGLCLRFSVLRAGKQSANDPKYTVQPQRRRRSVAE